jgi:hypothetical protein
MEWWIDPDEYVQEPVKTSSKDIDWNQKMCYHEWKSTVLIISVVYDCAKCGVKKEKYDEWKKQNS